MMKCGKWWKLIVIVVILMVSKAQIIAGTFQNEPDGFRGIKWGTRINEIPGLKLGLTKYDGKLKYYSKENDNMKIGEAGLSGISYVFWDDSFYQATILVKSYLNFLKLKAAVFEKYGKIDQDKKVSHEQYTWKGDKATVDLSYVKGPGVGSLMIRDSQTWGKILEYTKSKAKKAADKDF